MIPEPYRSWGGYDISPEMRRRGYPGEVWRPTAEYPYRYNFRLRILWGSDSPLFGKHCRVLARGAMNARLVEFEDGTLFVVSGNALRKRSGDIKAAMPGLGLIRKDEPSIVCPRCVQPGIAGVVGIVMFIAGWWGGAEWQQREPTPIAAVLARGGFERVLVLTLDGAKRAVEEDESVKRLCHEP